MSFKFKFTTKVSTWKAMISAFSSMTDECVFVVNEEEMRGEAMDPSHHSAVRVVCVAKGFSSFECRNETEFAFRTDDMMKIIKRMKSEGDVIVGIPEEKNSLHMLSNDKEYQLNLIHSTLVTKVPTELKVTPIAKFEIEINKLIGMIDDVAVLGEQVNFILEKGYLFIESSGDSGKARAKIMDMEGEGNSNFDVSYLKSFLNSISSLVEKANVELCNQQPITIRMNPSENESIMYFLSPVVGSNQ